MQLRPYQIRSINETFEALIKNDDPVLMEASVGSGKSIMIASIVKRFDNYNKRVLCLVNSSELVRNNSNEFKNLGGSPSIFCASLRLKDYSNNIVFATPQSIISAIKNNHPIGEIIFNMIVIDEAHGINFVSKNSVFMRILRHYKQAYKPMRLLGLTGTAFRGSSSIVGCNALFKVQVGNISTQYLIENGFLVKPTFGNIETDSYDFSKCKINNTGEFNSRDLQVEIDSKKRLTWEILQNLKIIMKNRNICMIYCSTRAHCFEALSALPANEARIILGDTSDEDRNESLTLARQKKIKYLISVNCLMTGVNITAVDCIAWLRPTSSLLLYIQGIGRGLRLHEGKENCLILDYANNITRFSDIDHPIINEAIQLRGNHEEEERPFKCWKCETYNSIFNRRCIGVVDGKRCDHFFQFKSCPICNLQSDVTARTCRGCGHELIDPNAKLTRTIQHTYKLTVIEATYWVTPQGNTSNPIIHAKYNCKEGEAFETYFTSSEKSRTILYNNFVKQHVNNPSSIYKKMSNLYFMRQMVNSDDIKTPYQIECTKDGYGRFKLKRKMFYSHGD